MRAGATVFRQGERDDAVYRVRSGLLKASYLRPDGRAHIKSFICEGGVIGSMVSAARGGACSFTLSALEDTELTALPYRALQSAARDDLAIANALIDFLSGYAQRKERREYELLSLSPEDRYARLLSADPALVSRLTQADIAAHVGITPQALSRIKKRRGMRGARPGAPERGSLG